MVRRILLALSCIDNRYADLKRRLSENGCSLLSVQSIGGVRDLIAVTKSINLIVTDTDLLDGGRSVAAAVDAVTLRHDIPLLVLVPRTTALRLGREIAPRAETVVAWPMPVEQLVALIDALTSKKQAAC